MTRNALANWAAGFATLTLLGLLMGWSGGAILGCFVLALIFLGASRFSTQEEIDKLDEMDAEPHPLNTRNDLDNHRDRRS